MRPCRLYRGLRKRSNFMNAKVPKTLTSYLKNLVKIFLQGLFAVIPLVLTLYVVYWLAKAAESMFAGTIKLLTPGEFYIHGSGLLAALIVVLCVGLLFKVPFFSRLSKKGGQTLERIPLLRSVYGPVKDLMGFFDTSKKKHFEKVAMVNFGKDFRLLGLVTREDFSRVAEGVDEGETIAVYLPMSYQVGGYTVFVTRKDLQFVDMGVEEAMRFAVTAAVSAKKTDPTYTQPNKT